MNRLLIYFFLFFFISGCYQSSLTPMMVIGPATGATQGKLAQSILSTSINYGVKEKTGKYPYEHIIKRERDKLLKKASKVEKKIVSASQNLKSKTTESTKKIINHGDYISKKNLKEKAPNLYASFFKIKEASKETFFTNRPRYSYRSLEK